MNRLITEPILKDLKSKMVFLGGPRQCGKTHLAKEILKKLDSENNYFNWDSYEDRKIILAQKWSNERIIVLDEIHKYPKWKTFVKGIYDTQKEFHNFLITGSARLNIYKRGGDSMLGRYHYWRLHPFTLNEIPPKISLAKCVLPHWRGPPRKTILLFKSFRIGSVINLFMAWLYLHIRKYSQGYFNM